MTQEQKIEKLEKRIEVLESQRPIINIYPYQQPVQTYHPYYTTTGGALAADSPTTGGGNSGYPGAIAYSMCSCGAGGGNCKIHNN